MKILILPFLLVSAIVAAPSDHDSTVIVPSLKGIVFVANAKDIQKTGLTTSGVSAAPLPMLNQPAFNQEVSAYIGHPLTFKQLNEITSKVAAFYKAENHPLVNVVAPEQDVSTGVIQILVQEYRVGEVRVQGNRWFSDKVIAGPIHLEHGDTIDTQKLLAELDAANANPFRRVDLVYEPGAQPGYTDLVLNTKDRFPVTAYTGFDNSGTSVTGRSRWNLGATWGNALMHDQQLGYQFSASDNFFSRNGPVGFLSNALSWTMPVRAADSLTIFGSYQKSIPNIGSDFGYVGKSGQASIRYSVALHRTKRYIQTLQFGYDFKTTNNNLAFGGTDVAKTSTEIDQFPVTYAANLTDKLGASSFNTSLVYSPGQMTPNNTTTDFRPDYGQSGIAGASAHYTYWRTEFNRLNKLPKNGVYALRVIGQTSSTNLLYTEKLAGGGPDILRGYDPYSVYGDHGVIMSNELRTADLKPWPEHGLGEAQFYIFWDYGHLTAAKPFPGVVNSLSASSVGTGVRYNLRSNFTGNVNYGRALIQLPNTNSAARNSFVDLALTLAY